MDTHSRATNIKIIIFFIVIGFILYAKIINGTFVFDDIHNIVENPAIWKIENAHLIWNQNATRFIPYFSFAINYAVSAAEPQTYHLFNILIHCINAFLIYLFSKLIFSSKYSYETSIRLSFFTGLIFLCHPLQTESVSYIVQRITSLSAFFYLLVIYWYSQYLATKNVHWYNLSLGAGFLAIFTKENVFVLPVALALCECLLSPAGSWKDRLRRISPFIVFVLVIPILLWFNIQQGRDLDSILSETNTILPGHYFLTQCNVIRTYIQLFFCPIGQNVDHDILINHSFFEPSVFISFVLLAAIILVAFLLRSPNRIIFFGLLWFFIHLAIESSFIPIKDVIQEHRMYLPILGSTLVTIEIINSLFHNHKVKIFILLSVVSIFSIFTLNRNTVWQSSLNLWKDSVAKSPRKVGVRQSYAEAVMHDNRLNEARQEFYNALKLDDQNYKIYNNLGLIALRKKEFSQAIDDFKRALKINKKSYETLNNLGITHFQLNDTEKAEIYFRKAHELNPYQPEPLLNLGLVYEAQNNWDQAWKSYLAAYDLRPKDERVLDVLLRTALKSHGHEDILGRAEEFLQHIRSEALLVGLGGQLATAGRKELAVKYFLQAIVLYPQKITAYREAGKVLANAGHFAQAAAMWNAALQKDPTNQELKDLLKELAVVQAQSKG